MSLLDAFTDEKQATVQILDKGGATDTATGLPTTTAPALLWSGTGWYFKNDSAIISIGDQAKSRSEYTLILNPADVTITLQKAYTVSVDGIEHILVEFEDVGGLGEVLQLDLDKVGNK